MDGQVREGVDRGSIEPVTGLAVGLALLAAVLFALASVAQQRTAADVPDEQAGGLGLMSVLVRRPLWWAGSLGDAGGYAAQAAALAFGSLLLVQPLLVTTLLVALPLGARAARRPLGRATATWAVLLAVALAVFVVVGDPTAGIPDAPAGRWLPAGIVIVLVLAGCLGGVAGRRGTVRSALLAVATGVLYGVTAAMTKSVVATLDDGLLAVLTNWETYALAVAVTAGTLLQQAAFQAGDLRAALPAVTVGEPVVAAVLGLAVLEEQIRANGRSGC